MAGITDDGIRGRRSGLLVAECEERRLINESGSSNFSLEGRDLGCGREKPLLNGS
jgi:hypothetical protein